MSKVKKGDLVEVDCPGTAIHGMHALVTKILYRPYIGGVRVESDFEILPLGSSSPMMMRQKWLKIISKNEKNS